MIPLILNENILFPRIVLFLAFLINCNFLCIDVSDCKSLYMMESNIIMSE